MLKRVEVKVYFLELGQLCPTTHFSKEEIMKKLASALLICLILPAVCGAAEVITKMEGDIVVVTSIGRAPNEDSESGGKYVSKQVAEAYMAANLLSSLASVLQVNGNNVTKIAYGSVGNWFELEPYIKVDYDHAQRQSTMTLRIPRGILAEYIRRNITDLSIDIPALLENN